jgi:sialic acid synthase SpsE
MPDTITIAGRKIGRCAPCFIVAEVGINHGGNETLCADMISQAASAGADAVKLQIVTADESYHPDTESYRLFRNSNLPREALARQMSHARQAGVILFATPGDPTALQLLCDVGVPAIKISSGLLTNLPLIRLAARSGKPLLMSTGMAHSNEIDLAVAAAREAGCQELALLQCTSLYPAPAETLNLRAMEGLWRTGVAAVGYSDHHSGHLACLAAVAGGASIIEKHFTLDATQAGADHAISIEPPEFAEMVQAIRSIEAMLGSRDKAPVADEMPLRSGRHRRLVAARDLKPGERLETRDLYLMRLPADREALPADRLEHVLGRRTKRLIPRLTAVTDDMLEGA